MQQANVSDNDKFDLMTQDVARKAEVSGQTVRQWERAGKLRAVRTANGTRLFSSADVDRIIRERSAAAGTAK